MDDRKFLEKIRQLQKNGNQIKLTEIVDTKLFNNKKTLLFEEDSTQGNIETINSQEQTDVQTIEPDEQREEENNFKNTVAKLVKFEPIKVHKENVEWSGHLIREKINWYYSLDDSIGCYIDTTELIQLTDGTLEVLKKLRGYYDVWSDNWSSRLTGGPSIEGQVTTSVKSPETSGESETTGGAFGF